MIAAQSIRMCCKYNKNKFGLPRMNQNKKESKTDFEKRIKEYWI